MNKVSQASKIAVLNQLTGGSWRAEGKVGYRFSAGLVHTRFKTSGPYSFNINPATLKADFELWICGSPDLYYLLPKEVVRSIYDHPNAYVDQRHLEIRVVSVDTDRHRAKYARETDAMDLRPYFLSTLP